MQPMRPTPSERLPPAPATRFAGNRLNWQALPADQYLYVDRRRDPLVTSWNRRVAAATREREPSDADGVRERLNSLGLPENLHPDDLAAVTTLIRVAQGRDHGFSTTLLGRVMEPDADTENDVEQVVKILVLGNGNTARALVSDADELEFDSLTGLPGRAYVLEQIDGGLQEALGEDHAVGVFSIDVDRFKTINDTRGFAAGDDSLRTLAAHLVDSIRAGDVIGRLGGDEFTIVCAKLLGLAEASAFGERFRSVCAGAPIDSPLAGLTLSVGIALGGADRNADDLLRESETAFFQAKALGRDRCELFDDDMRTQAERRIDVSTLTSDCAGLWMRALSRCTSSRSWRSPAGAS